MPHQQVAGAGVGHEVIAIVGIGVHGARVGTLNPRQRCVEDKFHRTVCIETNFVVESLDGHLHHVVRCGTIQFLAKHVSAIAKDADVLWRGESHGLQLGIGEFIHAVLGNGDSHPFAAGKFRLVGIDGRIEGLCRKGHDEHDGDAQGRNEFVVVHIIFIMCCRLSFYP